MSQYILMFTAVVRLRYDEGSLVMSHYLYFRQLVKLLYREVEEIDREMGLKNSIDNKKTAGACSE